MCGKTSVIFFFGLMTPSKRILDDFGCSFHKRRIKPAVVELNDLQICRRENPLDRGKNRGDGSAGRLGRT